MNRVLGAVCSAAVLVVAVTACRPFGTALPEPAPPSAQWILDAVSPEDVRPPRCPKPTLATLAVLDDDDRSWAEAFWLVDDVDVCSVAIHNLDTHWMTVAFTSIEGLTISKPTAENAMPSVDSYVFTAFHGAVNDVRVSPDSAYVVGPVHTRTVVLGYDEIVTFVGYHVRLPQPGQSVPLDLCTAPDQCRDATLDGPPTDFAPTTPPAPVGSLPPHRSGSRDPSDSTARAPRHRL